MSIPDWQIDDDWRRDSRTRLKSYPPPDVPIWDYSEGEECICLRINAKWVGFLTGVISVLEDPIFWQDDTDGAITSIIELQTALQGASDLMNCDLSQFVKDVTFDGTVLRITKGDDTETIVENSETIVTGIQAIGTGWEVQQGGEYTAIDGDCGACDQYPDKPDYDKSGGLRSCAIATNLVEWVMEKYQDCLDAADAAGGVLAAADSILLLFPPAYVFWDAASDSVKEWYDASIAIARALDTVGLREDMKEFLYCQLVNNDHTFSDTIWDAFKDEFALVGDSIYLYLGAFKYDAVNTEAHKASYGEDTGCITFVCGTCFNRTLDFKASQECSFPRRSTSGAYPNVDWGQYVGGTGWKSVRLTGGAAGAGQYNRLQLIVDLGEIKTLSNVRYKWSIQSGAPTQESVDVSNNMATWTRVHNVTPSAGNKTFSLSSVSARYVLFILERGVADPPAILPTEQWTLEEVEVTTT